ncbi:MAG: hypothetical protein ABSD74_13705 [Rhizomicrobium sp.]|jgi:hypothetical protein
MSEGQQSLDETYLAIRRFFGWALLGFQILCVVALLTILIPFTKEICTPDPYTHAKECAQHHLGPQVGIWIVLIADAHNGLISAIAGILVAGFTAILFIATDAQAKITAVSIKLARDEFNATHRPRIRIRSTEILYHGGFDKNAEISFVAANAGESPATVTRFVAVGYVQEDVYTFHPRLELGRVEYPEALIIDPGQPVLVQAKCANLESEYSAFISTPSRLFIVGEIEYKGPDGISRLTGFCREYLKKDGMWHIPDIPTWEYSD